MWPCDRGGRHSLVQVDGLGAVDVVPPVAGQLVLVEDGAVRAEKRGARVAVTVVFLADVVRLQRSGQVRQVTATVQVTDTSAYHAIVDTLRLDPCRSG